MGPSVLFNQAFQTFNSLNIFILAGDGAQGMELCFDSLMARALDEPDAVYGLVAEKVLIEGGSPASNSVPLRAFMMARP